MCGICGCGEGAQTTVTDPVTGEHTHVLRDGTVITHSHGGDGSGHSHAHGEGHSHSHGEGHGHSHAHGHSHSHAHEHEPVHVHEGGHSHGHSGSAPVSLRGHLPPEVEAIEAKVLAKNDSLAERNRAFFLGRKALAVNLMSSPGSGKTTLLERTLRDFDGPVSVLEGDQETANDAARIRATGAPVVQINTGTGCHLEADMVWHGLEKLDPPLGATIFIENVGNLVCPALFDLGEDARIVLFSVTEGEDKPIKYPHMFRRADLVLLTKVDLLPYLDFDRDQALTSIRTVAPDAETLDVSSKSGEGLDAWYRWLLARRAAR